MDSSRQGSYHETENDPQEVERLSRAVAHANLMRMRGQYKDSISECLSILKQMPDNTDAHTLLGDIYAEQGDLEQSAQWYELALDLTPKSVVDKQKLDAVRERMQQRETAATAEQLGLPPDRSRLVLLAAVLFVFVVVLGFGAYLMGQRFARPSVASGTNAAPPLTAPNQENSPTDSALGVEEGNPAPKAALSSVVLPEEDRALTLMLTQKSSMGSHVLTALQDPRTKQITVTYSLGSSDDDHRIGSELAKTAFDLSQDCQTVTVRGMRNDHLVFVADALRSRLAETQTPAWQQQNPSPDAWIGRLFSTEWSEGKGMGGSSTSGASGPTSEASSPPAPTSGVQTP